MKNFFFLFLALIAGCANPLYAPENDPKGNSGQGTELSCLAQFRSGLCVSWAWEKLPTEEEFGSFTFKLYRDSATGKILEDISGLSVLLWMPGMGHGSSPITLERLATGSYRATRVFFTMRGEWEIRFQSKEGQSLLDQAVQRIDF